MVYLAKRRTVGNLFSLHNEMGRVFDDFLGTQERQGNATESDWWPSVDIAEQEDSFKVQTELPGVSENDIQVSVTDNVLTIKGTKNQEEAAGGKNYHQVERRYGTFQRRFTLPRSADTKDIKADFKAGILTLSIPKLEAVQTKEIPITVNS